MQQTKVIIVVVDDRGCWKNKTKAGGRRREWKPRRDTRWVEQDCARLWQTWDTRDGSFWMQIASNGHSSTKKLDLCSISYAPISELPMLSRSLSFSSKPSLLHAQSFCVFFPDLSTSVVVIVEDPSIVVTPIIPKHVIRDGNAAVLVSVFGFRLLNLLSGSCSALCLFLKVQWAQGRGKTSGGTQLLFQHVESILLLFHTAAKIPNIHSPSAWSSCARLSLCKGGGLGASFM